MQTPGYKSALLTLKSLDRRLSPPSKLWRKVGSYWKRSHFLWKNEKRNKKIVKKIASCHEISTSIIMFVLKKESIWILFLISLTDERFPFSRPAKRITKSSNPVIRIRLFLPARRTIQIVEPFIRTIRIVEPFLRTIRIVGTFQIDMFHGKLPAEVETKLVVIIVRKWV